MRFRRRVVQLFGKRTVPRVHTVADVVLADVGRYLLALVYIEVDSAEIRSRSCPGISRDARAAAVYAAVCGLLLSMTRSSSSMQVSVSSRS